MWGPRLTYRLEVRGRAPDDVVVFAPGSFRGWISCGKPCSHQASLSCVTVIMTLIRVHCVVETLCQTVIEQILALECLLPDTRESQRLHLILFDIK
jgi:hypothetical protein